ncbi:hypothetical protein BO78DRAFT_356177 [Aspergillus sclerotiicarbonarius CBS 121057]|uniref:Uncharacterized protein n=1 Tax=Aspergillus sclerotiicarbonarius (strain CBS 121057 / IBT 28362) TaxID=1448318 RepID=A0A319FNX7_ASPSB|nr:hypothetical protein BO78DRAFT_356177 [Aspergillus sclerotiicarbonarius CBS 121057]
MTVPDASAATLPVYRPAKPVPFELAQHAAIFFEERLYTQALDFLLNILISGTVASAPAFTPPVQQLAVAATLLVHPSTTTRAKTTEEEEAPQAALRLLRLTNTLVGPVSSKLGVAFTFNHFDAPRHTRRRPAEEVPAPAGLSSEDTKPLNLDLGQSHSIWSSAEDFWHAVGWAFNCSVLHRTRWARWQIWLELMCDVLESDWNERLRQQREAKPSDTSSPKPAPITSPTKTRSKKKHKGKGQDEDPSRQILKDSLIFRYISGASATYGRNRRIVRSIFADGGSTSRNEFREVFHNELKHAKTDSSNSKKRSAQVNIDEEEFGDYLTDDDEIEEEDENDEEEESYAPVALGPGINTPRGPYGGSAPSSRIIVPIEQIPTKHIPYMHGDVGFFGGMRSLSLRQRLLYLLSTVSQSLPDDFTSLEDLYHLFAENIRHLPLPVFQAFISPSTLPYFSPAAKTTLCEFLLFRMRETVAPDTDEEYLNQDKLERCFLPYMASTTSLADNAKISITLEALIVLLADSNMLRVTPKLHTAVVQGTQRRIHRSRGEARKSGQEAMQWADDIEQTWLLESGERLMLLVQEILPKYEVKSE